MKFNFRFSPRPEHVFGLLAALFGMLFLVLTPPFQSPDENRHFFRAYDISQGNLFPTKLDNRVGGFIPKSVEESLLPFSEMRGKESVKTTRDGIFNSMKLTNDMQKVFVDFPASSVYTPVSYAPQAIGIALVRLFSDSAILALYAGRLMTLICWILALFYAIRITPIFKWLFVALALLPMSLFIHVSLNADMMTNAVVFLLLAMILKNTFSGQQQTRKEFILIALLVFLLASVKFLYIPLLLVFLVIPKNKFKGPQQRVLRFGGLAVLALITTACWPIIQGVGYVSYADYNPDYRNYVNLLECANVQDQLAYMFSHGAYIFSILGNSLVESFHTFSVGFIGSFGWAESSLSIFWVIFAYLVLMLIALADGNPMLQLKPSQRILLLVPFVLIFVLIIVSQYLIWACVGSDSISNLQGRYLIPIVPLLLFVLYRSKNKFERFLPIGVITFSTVLLLVSTFQIYERFFVPRDYAIETITCDHEGGKGTDDFSTSNSDVLAKNGFSRSNEKARSGSFSSKVSSTINYGSLISIKQVSFGDIVEVEAWRMGENGLLIVSSEGGTKLYEATSKAEPSSKEWKKMQLKVFIPESMENEKVSCYVGYMNPVDSCYFDDIKLTLKRLK